MGNLLLRRRMMMAQGGVSLPVGYTKIEYLESDGTNYIDTGFKPSNNTRVIMNASLLSLDGDQYFYGAKDTGSTQSFVCAYSEGSITFGYGSSFPSASYNASVLQKISIDQNCNDGYINGLKVVTANDAIFQTPYSLYLCARNNGDSVTKLTKLMIYSCQIYDNDVLVRDFIPCTNPDGISGLWDSVNDVFYKMLHADYTRLDFIETDGTAYIDTGFKPNQDTRVVCDAQVLGSGETGIAMATDAQYYYTLYVKASVVGTRYGNQDQKTFASNAPAYNKRLIYDKNKNVTTVGGYTISHNAATFQLAYSLYLFARNNAGTTDWVGKVRLYSCQIYDNGTLVRDFIPAMNASGEAGLYDLKNDVWYALLPVAKPKVENKITFSYYNDLRENSVTGVITIYTYITINSTYAITSDLNITFENNIGVSKTFTMSKGSSVYNPAAVKNFGTPTLSSISPTEDDTYIYTF